MKPENSGIFPWVRHGFLWPSARIVAIGYLVGFCLLAANTLVTLWNLQTIRKVWRAHCLADEVIGRLESLLSNLRDAETGQRGYILTGEEAYLEPFRNARARLDASVQQAIALTKMGERTDDRVRAIAETTAAKLAELEQTIQLRKEKGLEPAVAVVKTGHGKALMDELRAGIAAMEADEHRAQDQHKAALEKQMGFTLLTFLLSSLLALVLLLAIQYLDRKNPSGGESQGTLAGHDALQHWRRGDRDRRPRTAVLHELRC